MKIAILRPYLLFKHLRNHLWRTTLSTFTICFLAQLTITASLPVEPEVKFNQNGVQSITSITTTPSNPQASPLTARINHQPVERQDVTSAITSRSGKAIVHHRDIQPRSGSIESLSPKRFFDFITDPSLLITVLHSLEVAYWTFPFGFVLSPIINFFRVPNRRRSLEDKQTWKPFSHDTSLNRRMSPQEEQLNMLYARFLQSLQQYHKLTSPQTTVRQQLQPNVA